MKRVMSGLKQCAPLYLIFVGGGYALAGLVGVTLNMRDLFQSTNESETRTLRDDVRVESLLFFFASLFLIAGIGVLKSRPWGLILAVELTVIVVAYSLVHNWKGASDYHDFTLALPMALIFLWGILPQTWSMFRKQDVKAS